MSDARSPSDSTDGRVQVVAVVTCYNGRTYLDDCLKSLLASGDRWIDLRVVVVDNASTDGTATQIAKVFPQIDLLVQPTNLGYAGGANAGWAHVQRTYPQASYLVLLNQDTIVQDGWLAPLVRFLQRHEQVGIVGPKIRLYPETDKINTIGNRSHYLGFGFVTGYGQVDRGQFDQAQEVDFVSGAAVMVRTALLKEIGLFDDRFFMYLEDAELAWKASQLGQGIWVEPASVVFHHYSPDAPLRHYGLLERNRWLLVLTYYRLRSLAVLAPALLVMEMGQLFFAATHRNLRQKIKSYAFFLRPTNLMALWRRRRLAQRRRQCSDRQFMAHFCGIIDFGPLNGVLLRHVANPLLGTYWKVAKRLIRW